MKLSPIQLDHFSKRQQRPGHGKDRHQQARLTQVHVKGLHHDRHQRWDFWFNGAATLPIKTTPRTTQA